MSIPAQPPTMHGAVIVAIETFESTQGDERTRLLAALHDYTIAMRGANMLVVPNPPSPFECGDDAARYLADTSSHPRYAGPMGWELLLAPGHDLTLVQAAIRTRPSLPPETPTLVRQAVEVVKTAQRAANGAPAPLGT